MHCFFFMCVAGLHNFHTAITEQTCAACNTGLDRASAYWTEHQFAGQSIRLLGSASGWYDSMEGEESVGVTVKSSHGQGLLVQVKQEPADPTSQREDTQPDHSLPEKKLEPGLTEKFSSYHQLVQLQDTNDHSESYLSQIPQTVNQRKGAGETSASEVTGAKWGIPQPTFPGWDFRVRLKQEVHASDSVSHAEDDPVDSRPRKKARSGQKQTERVETKAEADGVLNRTAHVRPVSEGLESTVRRLWTFHSSAAPETAPIAPLAPAAHHTRVKAPPVHFQAGDGVRASPSQSEEVCDTQTNQKWEGSEEEEECLPLYFRSESGHSKTSSPKESCEDREVSDSKPYQCAVCDESFGQAVGLRTHIAQYKHRQSSRCGKCRRVFARCSSLTVHLKTHSDERPWKCTQCPATFRGQSGLIYHERTHSSKKPYVCEQCLSTFTDSSSLHRHLRVHSGEKPYKCQHCPATFAAQSSWVYHTRSHSGEKHYKCQHCPAAFTRPQHLKTHLLHHTSDTPFRCELCPEAFALRTDLREHRKTHIVDKPYKCDVCESMFADTGKLRRHMLVHSTYKPHKCEECPAEFAQLSHLRSHVRKHKGDRPYKCDQCDASFTHSASLWKHKKIHTGKRPFRCDECSSAFTTVTNLKRHKRTHRVQPPSDSKSNPPSLPADEGSN